MSANLPASFKPIAHYIKIANENASRDPVIYYWCETSWNRLRQLIEANAEITEERDELESIVNGHKFAQSLALEIEEKRVKCEALRRTIEQVNQKMLDDRRKLAEVEKKIMEKQQEEVEIQKQNLTAKKQIRKNREWKEKQRKQIHVLTRLVSYRKAAMISEVVDLFKVHIDFGPASEPNWFKSRKCLCHHSDYLFNHHLPQTSTALSHPELETTVALENFVRMFDAICRIIFYTPRHPIDTASCPPHISNPITGKSNALAGWKKKVDRERFVEAMVWMGRNISQLRSDCGFPTPTADDALSKLIEWLHLIGAEKPVVERPTCSIFSPASLLLNYQLV